MSILATILIAVVAVLHAYFLILEMFLWDKPAGMKAFRMTPEQAQNTKVLAANQGLYNGFLAAGLLLGIIMGDRGYEFKLFFLCCVILAGCYGAATASKKILYIQALPASLALISVLLE